MKIAIVGAADSVDKIYNTLEKKYTDIEFILKKEDKIEKMLKIIKGIKDEIDGIYLTGIGVYYALVNDNEIELDKPVVYTRRGSIGLIKSFWELKEKRHNILNLKLGIDVVEKETLLNVINEFDIKLEKIFYQKYEIQKTEEEYLEEYLKSYENREIDCVFTAFGYIYNVLKEKKIPVYRIQATNIEIESEFKTLLNSKEVEGKIQVSDNKEYMIISNIEMLKSKENLKVILNLKEDFEKIGEKLLIGIGEGHTIFQAEKNARVALKLSLNQEGKIFYSNGEKIRGPLLKVEELEYKSVSDEKIKNIADEIGISPIYLEKIKGMIKKQKKDSFTSIEIAKILNITPRSVNRIVKKIIEKDYAESVQVENSVTAGRPRRIIKFKI